MTQMQIKNEFRNGCTYPLHSSVHPLFHYFHISVDTTCVQSNFYISMCKTDRSITKDFINTPSPYPFISALRNNLHNNYKKFHKLTKAPETTLFPEFIFYCFQDSYFVFQTPLKCVTHVSSALPILIFFFFLFLISAYSHKQYLFAKLRYSTKTFTLPQLCGFQFHRRMDR